MRKLVCALLLSLIAACVVNTSNAQINLNFSIKLIPDEPVVVERPPQPTYNHVWIDGEWVWQNNQYVPQPGYWTIPEPDHVWERGEWAHRSDGSVYWEPGYWKPIPHVGVPNWIPEPNYLKPPRPSPYNLWVEGEWIWVGNHYMYQVGFWTVPEPNKIFMRGHWAQWPNGEWYWVKGYWQRIPQNVFVMSVPPEPVINRPPAPSPQHEWIEGEWSWQNNTFTFKSGYWKVRDPHRAWVRGYWHQRQNGGYYWIAGHWNFV